MLRRYGLAGQFLYCFFRPVVLVSTYFQKGASGFEEALRRFDLQIAQSNHANRLPDTQTYSRCDTTI